MNWLTRPIHNASANGDGTPRIRKTTQEHAELTAAKSKTREDPAPGLVNRQLPKLQDCRLSSLGKKRADVAPHLGAFGDHVVTEQEHGEHLEHGSKSGPRDRQHSSPQVRSERREIVLILLDGVVQFDRSDLGVEGVVDPFRRIIDISGSVFHQVRGLAHDEADHHADEDSPQTEDDEKADESCSTSLPAAFGQPIDNRFQGEGQKQRNDQNSEEAFEALKNPTRHQEHCDRERDRHDRSPEPSRQLLTTSERADRDPIEGVLGKLVSAAFALLCGSPVSAGVGVDRVRLSG